jgi:hypothetical protein
VFFGALTKLQPTAVGEFDDGSVNLHITQLLQPHQQAATSPTIRGSFRKAGLDVDVTILPFRIRMVEQTLRENLGLNEVLHRLVSLDDVSRRRQLQRFGIINSGFLPAESVIWVLLISLYLPSVDKSSLLEQGKSSHQAFQHETFVSLGR